MSSRRAFGSYAPGRISLYVSPVGLKSSGFRPADESSPMAPVISESVTQKSPMGPDSTRGARSLSAGGQFWTHRSFGGLTWESAEMIRSVAIASALLNLSSTGGAPL